MNEFSWWYRKFIYEPRVTLKALKESADCVWTEEKSFTLSLMKKVLAIQRCFKHT
jgi:hypothetical protein